MSVRDTILYKKKYVNCFFLYANGTSVVTSKEQLVLIVCFYDDHQTEDFLCFNTANCLMDLGFPNYITRLRLEMDNIH